VATITDYEKWLEAADLDDVEIIYALYQAVLERETYAPWQISTRGDKSFVKCGFVKNTLMLPSEKARKTFLSLISKNIVEISMKTGTVSNAI
jgi:hypothetical protein